MEFEKELKVKLKKDRSELKEKLKLD